MRKLALNNWTVHEAHDARFLAEPSSWCQLDYRTIASPNVTGRVDWTATESGVAHGLAVWFETMLLGGVGYASGPLREDSAYGTAFFPFLEPIALTVGETIAVDLAARLVGDRYVFRWKTETSHARFDRSPDVFSTLGDARQFVGQLANEYAR